ncbi:F-box/LRR-repeat protein 7-like, partial [Schistocerca americana]|uniref:F-box/LRR-repeat protein 7-like n=1 Tax=Schistocerca americana TaxID=7009 RepID=UPI001F4FBC29
GGGGRLGRLSPMVCPLAKLGRASPTPSPSPSPAFEPYRYQLEQPQQQPHPGYHQPYHAVEHQAYHKLGHASAADTQAYQLRASPSLEHQAYHHKLGRSSPALDHRQGYHHQLEQSYHLLSRRSPSPSPPPPCYHQAYHHKLGRASPSLDQGYHTLVSPSPGPSTPGPWVEPASKTKASSSSSSCRNPWERLPDEAVVRIFSWLDAVELSACARVCRRFNVLAWQPQLWRVVRLRGDRVCADKALRAVLRRLGVHAAVERLLVSDGARATDRGVVLAARRCPLLTHLQLAGCGASVSTGAVAEVATRCANLQHLDLTGESAPPH